MNLLTNKRSWINSVYVVLLISTGFEVNSEEIASWTDMIVLENPIFYTSFVPIIHEFATPTWNSYDLRVKWPEGHSDQCEFSDEFQSNWETAGCPSVHHFNSIIDEVYEKTSSWKQPSNLISTSSKNQDFDMQKFCLEIQSHFTTSTIDFGEWQTYSNALESCSNGSSAGLLKVEKSYDFSKLDLTRLDRMLSKFYNTWPGLFLKYSYSNGATYTNAYSAYQTVALLKHIVEMNLWKDSLSICQSKRIPKEFITEKNLKKALQKVSADLFETSHDSKVLSISFESENHLNRLGLYYSLPLANCAFFEDSYIVRTLVPVIPKDSEYQLIQIKTNRYAYQFNSSEKHNLICEVLGVEGNYILDFENKLIISKTDCKPNELCLLPGFDGTPNVNSCIFAISTYDFKDIQRFCEIKCNYFPTKHFPINVENLEDSNLQVKVDIKTVQFDRL